MKESIDYWFSYMTSKGNFPKNIIPVLQKEWPLFISWVGERSCNLQCKHCIFQKEKSFGENEEAERVLLNLVSNTAVHHKPIVIHEGRILRKWHLPILKKIQDQGSAVGLIDNGMYVHVQDHFEQKIDWIDISIDGTEAVHNLQRNNGEAHQVAIKGIEKGREVAKRVTSLFTVTSINYNSVHDSCSQVIDMVDEFHITPVSPVRPEIMFTETSEKEFQSCWKQIANLQSKYTDKVFVRMYRHEDLVKVAKINPTAFAEAFSKPVGVSQGRIIIQFEGVTFSYLPKSLSINETIVVDSDDWYRLPYSIAYTIHELSNGIDRFGNDILNFSVEHLCSNSDFETIYHCAVSKWWNSFGLPSIQKEKQSIIQFFN